MKIAMLGAVCALQLSMDVSAAPITVHFSGTLNEDFGAIPTQFDGAFASGDAFEGSYTYDSKLAIIYSQPGTDVYNGVSRFEFVLNGLNYSANDAHIEVSNDVNFQQVDSIIINTGIYPSSGTTITGPEINELRIRSYGIDFRDYSGTALNNTDLPLGAPDLTAFKSSYMVFNFYDPSAARGYAFWGSIDSVDTVSPIPTPAAAWLQISGLAILGRAAYRVSHR